MEKYITILDISGSSCYMNVNARLVYLHVACKCDVSTYNYTGSVRRLADEVGLTYQQTRTAILTLEKCGFIKTDTVTQQLTRKLTHPITQELTQIHVVKINEINTAGNTAGNAAANAASNAASNADINNINNKNNKTPSLTSACVAWADMREVVKQALQVDAATAAAMVDTFKERQGMKGKTWKDEGDLKAHLISFAEKRLASLPRGTKGGRMSDAQARQQEYARAQEAQEAKGEKEKAWESVQDAWRWWKEAEKKAAAGKSDQEREKAAQQAAAMKAAYERLKQEWYNKFKST